MTQAQIRAVEYFRSQIDQSHFELIRVVCHP